VRKAQNFEMCPGFFDVIEHRRWYRFLRLPANMQVSEVIFTQIKNVEETCIDAVFNFAFVEEAKVDGKMLETQSSRSCTPPKGS
jgi:hypothetical protein